MTQTCVRQLDLGATKHTPMVRFPLVLLNPTINTKFSCGKCEKLMVVQQLVPGTKTGYFTLANNNNNKQQQHVSVPFWPLLGPNASDLFPMRPSWSLGGALAKSKF